MRRKKIIIQNQSKLVVAAAMISITSILLTFSLKHLTESAEHFIRDAAYSANPLLFIVLPLVGLMLIHLLRKYFFHNRKNKGITEIYKTLDQRKDHLPFFKITSHYLNGFLTIVSGGSTGIEVAAVVTTATVGNQGYENKLFPRKYKREFICAGVAAGIAVLFSSPLAGWLFAMEVIARKIRKSLVVACTVSVAIAAIFIYFFDKELRPGYLTVTGWYFSALPFFFLLGLLSGIFSAYFTVLVIQTKVLFSKVPRDFIRTAIGALSVGVLVFFLPCLYGDSYYGLHNTLQRIIAGEPISYVLLGLVIFLKPLAASLTLGAGGDGGVFAPSIVSGAFLGLLFALVCNNILGTGLIPLNFALVGAAATLSSSVLAPATALVLVCNLAPNGYNLFIPMLIGVFVSKLFFQRILPYNVYTYDLYKMAKG